MSEWTWESLPPELVVLHDAPGGTSLRGLAGILNAYDTLRAGPDLAWAGAQVEQVAAKYEGFAENEPNPLVKTAMQFAAQIMRAELVGGTVNGRSVVGRFSGAGESSGRHE